MTLEHDPSPGTFVWLAHHHDLLGILSEPMSVRIDYIKRNKPPWERATRLEWFRAVLHPEWLPPPVLQFGAVVQSCLKADAAIEDARLTIAKCDSLYKCNLRVLTETYNSAVETHQNWNRLVDNLRRNFSILCGQPSERDAIEARHAEECPGCPWNGTLLVMPDRPLGKDGYFLV